MIRGTPVDGFIGCAAALAAHDYASAVATVKSPVLFLVGEKDGATPAAMRKLSEKLPGSRFVAFAGAGHISNMDRPAEFTGADLRLFGRQHKYRRNAIGARHCRAPIFFIATRDASPAY